jgi:hypothetical protein
MNENVRVIALAAALLATTTPGDALAAPTSPSDERAASTSVVVPILRIRMRDRIVGLLFLGGVFARVPSPLAGSYVKRQPRHRNRSEKIHPCVFLYWVPVSAVSN